MVKKAGTDELEVQQVQKNKTMKTMKIKILLLLDTTVTESKCKSLNRINSSHCYITIKCD